jgi:hypothetical protein
MSGQRWSSSSKVSCFFPHAYLLVSSVALFKRYYMVQICVLLPHQLLRELYARCKKMRTGKTINLNSSQDKYISMYVLTEHDHIARKRRGLGEHVFKKLVTRSIIGALVTSSKRVPIDEREFIDASLDTSSCRIECILQPCFISLRKSQILWKIS